MFDETTWNFQIFKCSENFKCVCVCVWKFRYSILKIWIQAYYQSQFKLSHPYFKTVMFSFAVSLVAILVISIRFAFSAEEERSHWHDYSSIFSSHLQGVIKSPDTLTQYWTLSLSGITPTVLNRPGIACGRYESLQSAGI